MSMQQQVDNASLNEVNIGALEDNVTEEAIDLKTKVCRFK
jgi:hypothetical protein